MHDGLLREVSMLLVFFLLLNSKGSSGVQLPAKHKKVTFNNLWLAWSVICESCTWSSRANRFPFFFSLPFIAKKASVFYKIKIAFSLNFIFKFLAHFKHFILLLTVSFLLFWVLTNLSNDRHPGCHMSQSENMLFIRLHFSF